MAALLGFLRRRDTGRRHVGLHGENERPFGELVAQLDLDLFHHAVHRRGHVHRRLVGLEGHQRRFGLDRIARLDQHFDDRDILEVADVGDFDFNQRCHDVSPQINMRRMSASRRAKWLLNRAAAAPSMTR